MGIVYRAEDLKLGRPVALKVLPPQVMGDEESRARFFREARAAAAVSHPNLATVYEVGDEDGIVFIAMEWIDGTTLREHVGSSPLPVTEALRIAVAIAEGLARAHAAGVLHRDLKPDNVMVARDGQVKILDFGLAKPFDPALAGRSIAETRAEMSLEFGGPKAGASSPEITHAGQILGTPAYMSPEQARGLPGDARSDVFSFGATFYQMVTGKRPFEAKSPGELLAAIEAGRLLPPRQIRPDLSIVVERIILRSLARSPGDRYPTADDLLADLRRARASASPSREVSGTRAAFAEGRMAGPYHLGSILGAGGMAVVYRGTDAEGRPAAIKVLNAAVADESLVRRFEREALARIDHPNVVRVLGAGVCADGALYLALELLEGEDLATKLERGPLAPEDVVRIGAQVADGLDAVHETGVIHRDVKPSNVFVCTDGTAKLLDFGIALRSESETRMTRHGMVVGTPAYLSPEQAKGAGNLDLRSDIWSLGATLYHALVGRPPFQRDSTLATMVAVLLEDVPPPASIRPDAPPALAAALVRALSKRTADRWGAAGDFAEALRGADLSIRPTSVPQSPEAVAEVRLVSVVLLEGVTDLFAVEDAMRRQGGSVLPLLGGRALGLFGSEVSEGDEAARATRAAVAIRHLARRVGVATGRAALGTGAIAGEAVLRAEDACGLSSKGVVVDEATRRGLSSDIHVHAAAPGFFEVVDAPKSSRPPDPTSSMRQTKTVGREVEVAQIKDALERALEGRAIVVACTGPAGIGKTRLRAELASMLDRHTGIRVLTARAEARGRPVLAEAAASLEARFDRAAPLEERRKALAAIVSEGIADTERALECLEVLGEVLGTPFPASPRLSAARADPEIMADRLRLAIGDLLDGLAARGPVALLLEDLQWADAFSMDTLAEVLDRLAERALLVFVSGRPELLDARPDLFAGREVVRVVPRALGFAEVARLAVAVAGRALPEELNRALSERTAGNPFFVEQIVLDLRDGGRLDAPPAELGLPPTVEAAVQSRLDHLPREEKELCKRAAVFGRTFWLESLASLGVPAPESAIEGLLRRDILTARGRPRLAGLREYQFKSAVLAEVAYGLLPDEVRAALHAAAAAFLESRPEEGDEEIARHLERAGRGADSADRYARAALSAAARGDTEAVVRCSERALALGVADTKRFGLHVARADAFRHLGRTEEEAADLAEALHRASSPAERAMTLSAQSVVLSRAGRTEEAIVRAEEAVTAARASGDPEAIAVACGRFAIRLALAGRTGDATGAIDEAVKAAPSCGVLTRARVAGWRASVLALSGDVAAERRAWEEALAACKEAGDVRLLATTEANFADCHNRMGLHDEAERALRAALESCARTRNRSAERYVLANLGHTLSALGRHDEALGFLTRAGAEAEASGDAKLLVVVGVYRAIALAGLGALAEAAEHADVVALRAAERGIRGWQARALTVAARARMSLGDRAGALDRSSHALQVRDEVGGLEEGDSDLFEVHAEALEASGRAEDARAVRERSRVSS
jgi:serine/threonine protein kinase/tetratricopeptide (TPR) repeat protein